MTWDLSLFAPIVETVISHEVLWRKNREQPLKERGVVANSIRPNSRG
jgi:hypothetical protein